MVADPAVATTFEVTTNVAVVDPAAIVMLAGTVAKVVLLLVKVTRRWVALPVAGAVRIKVAVALEVPPPRR